MKFTNTIKCFALMIAIAGCFLIANGSYIKVKACVAQILLEHSWEKSMQENELTKPWPWADTWPIARLKSQNHDVDLIVLEGDSGSVLAFGPGRMMMSAFPGGPGNFVISGHKDTSFKFLKDIEKGEIIQVQDQIGIIHKYVVSGFKIETASDIELDFYDRTSQLTLITCYPFTGLPGGQMRYLVFADRVETDRGKV